jgi:hypothetical protein
MRSNAGSGTIAARLVRLRPAILLVILVVMCVVHYGFGSGRMAATACSPEAKATLEQIARAPADALDYRGRAPWRDCVTEFATPRSAEIRRILVLRDTRRCARDFCLTEIWAEHRVSGFSAGYPYFLFTRPGAAVDRSAPVPTLAFVAWASSGEVPFRLVYSRMAALYLPIHRGGSPDPPNFRPMRFRPIETDGRMALFGNGDVASDTIRYFERAVRDHGIAPGSTLFLNSNGGDTVGGMALGRAIRRLGLRTDVARGGPPNRPSELRVHLRLYVRVPGRHGTAAASGQPPRLSRTGQHAGNDQRRFERGAHPLERGGCPRLCREVESLFARGRPERRPGRPHPCRWPGPGVLALQAGAGLLGRSAGAVCRAPLAPRAGPHGLLAVGGRG